MASTLASLLYDMKHKKTHSTTHKVNVWRSPPVAAARRSRCLPRTGKSLPVSFLSYSLALDLVIQRWLDDVMRSGRVARPTRSPYCHETRAVKTWTQSRTFLLGELDDIDRDFGPLFLPDGEMLVVGDGGGSATMNRDQRRDTDKELRR